MGYEYEALLVLAVAILAALFWGVERYHRARHLQMLLDRQELQQQEYLKQISQRDSVIANLDKQQALHRQQQDQQQQRLLQAEELQHSRELQLRQLQDEFSDLKADRSGLQQRAHEMTERVRQLGDELMATKNAAEQVRQHNEQLRQRLGAADEQSAQLQQRDQSLKEADERLQVLQQQVVQLRGQLTHEQASRAKELCHAEEKLQLLAGNSDQLKRDFSQLAQQIFDQKQKQFAERSQQDLKALLGPLDQQLQSFRQRIDDVHLVDAKDRAGLKAQLEELQKLNQHMSNEAAGLTKALKGEKKVQGNWGEMVLETVLERSGLRKDIEYAREVSFRSDDNALLRPDVVIQLPEQKHVVIDAKVSLNDYTDYVNAETDTERDQALKNHCTAVRNHIRRLADKAYHKLPGLNTPDFVFLFMPLEAAFSVAFEADDHIFQEAFEQRVVVVTPTTLLATLRTVASLWSIERQNRSAQQLAEQAARVYDKLRIFLERMEKIGAQIDTVQNSYREAWLTLKEGQGNLVSQTQKFVELGVRVKKDLPKSVLDSVDLEVSTSGASSL